MLAGLTVSELQDRDLLFQWLFHKFRNWKAIERKIEIIKDARVGSSKKTWTYLWAVINTYISNHDEDNNCANLESALAGKTIGAAAATTKKSKKSKKNKKKD